MDEPRELTTRQASERAGVSAQYIRRLLKDGRLKGRQLDGWQWLVDAADLDDWLNERRRPRRKRDS